LANLDLCLSEVRASAVPFEGLLTLVEILSSETGFEISLLRNYVFDKSAKINTKNGIYKLVSSFIKSYSKKKDLHEFVALLLRMYISRVYLKCKAAPFLSLSLQGCSIDDHLPVFLFKLSPKNT
jgi:hypothetical protein